MFRLHPSQQPPRGGAPLKGLPFATVLTLAGAVLLLGRSGAGLHGGVASASAEVELAAVDAESPQAERALEETAPGGERLASITGPRGQARQVAIDAGPSSGGGAEVGPLPDPDGPEVHTPALDPEAGPPGLEGLRAEGPFHLGSRHGEWTFYDHLGYVQEVGSYREGRRDGPWRHYARTGQMIQLAEFVEGAQEGLWRRFSQEGALIEEGSFEASSPHGRWVRRYSDGSIKERGRYEAGLREGLWEFFDDLGRPTLRTGTYRAGIRID